MANPDNRNFKTHIKAYYGCDVADLLLAFQSFGLTTDDVAEITGFSYETIRRWCNRYAIELRSALKDMKAEREYQRLQRKIEAERWLMMFKASALNSVNLLARKWSAAS